MLIICRKNLYRLIDKTRVEIEAEHQEIGAASAKEFLYIVLVIIAAVLNPCMPS